MDERVVSLQEQMRLAEEEIARVSREGPDAVDVDGTTALALLDELREGPLHLRRLKNLQLFTGNCKLGTSATHYVEALKRAGLVRVGKGTWRVTENGEVVTKSTRNGYLVELAGGSCVLEEADPTEPKPKRKAPPCNRARGDDVRRRLVAGRISAVREGFAPTGPAPYGYSKEKVVGGSVFQEVPEEAEVVRRIFREYVRLRSVLKVVSSLDSEGRKTKRGKKWSRAAVSWILKNDVYLGYVSYGKVRCRGKHVPIVTEEEFSAAQKVLRSNRKGRKKRRAETNENNACKDNTPSVTSPSWGEIAPTLSRTEDQMTSNTWVHTDPTSIRKWIDTHGAGALAETLGKSTSSVYNWANEVNTPSEDFQKKIAKAIGASAKKKAAKKKATKEVAKKKAKKKVAKKTAKKKVEEKSAKDLSDETPLGGNGVIPGPMVEEFRCTIRAQVRAVVREEIRDAIGEELRSALGVGPDA